MGGSDRPIGPDREALGGRCGVGASVNAPSFTHHARQVISERGIEVAWVIRVLEAPELTQPDPEDSLLERCYGRIVERDNRVLRVVINRHEGPTRIISAFFDRNMRNKL